MKKNIYKLIRYLNMRFIRPLFLGTESKGLEYYVRVGDRHYEYPFAIELCMKLGIKEILDIGCAGCHFPLFMASMGYKVCGTDINIWRVKHSNFRMIVDDIKNSALKNSSFDVITAISVIEHIGLDVYNEKSAERGDLKAMAEIYRILKGSGHLVLTVPYGKYQVYNEMTRIYDKEEFDNLIKEFTVLEQKFYGPIRDADLFEECSESETYFVDPYVVGDSCITCVVLQRKAIQHVD